MEFDFNAMLIGLIRAMSETKCEAHKEDKDADSLWCIYGQLSEYEKILTILAKACKDERGADLLNRINSELVDSLVCFIEADLDCIELERKENASRDTIQWRDSEVCKPETHDRVLVTFRTRLGGVVVASAYWLDDHWECYLGESVERLTIPMRWAPLNMPEEDWR